MRSFFLFLCLAACGCQTTRVRRDDAFTPRQVATLKQQHFEQVGDIWQFGMADRVLFATDESTLIPQQKLVIEAISSALTKVGIRGGRVDGHTDSSGKADYNEALSIGRAQAVADALIQGGMTPAAIRVVGRGARDPIESNRSASGRRENRRVVIIVSPADTKPPTGD